KGISKNFGSLLETLRIFLSVVLGNRMAARKLERLWVCDFSDGESGRPIDCRVRRVGYMEIGKRSRLPPAGILPAVKQHVVNRPGLEPVAGWPEEQEQWVPADIGLLWRTLRALPASQQEQFQRAGNAYTIAGSMWP